MTMATKRTLDHDPEYDAIPTEIQEKRIKLLEDNVRKQNKKKIEAIIKSNFEQEIPKKEEEIDAIDELLHEARNILDRLRACAVTKFYATVGQEEVFSEQQHSSSIHPSVKKYIGKSPKYLNCNSIDNQERPFQASTQANENAAISSAFNNDNAMQAVNDASEKVSQSNISPSKSDEISSRTPRFKKKCKIVVGNISKFIPVWQRDGSDHSTHKWMVYVRGDKNNPSIESFVKKVRFLLHPSYRPSDIIEISTPPFHLIKRGWGEFPVRVQLHFHDPRNKPVDIIHNLKLDKTFTGLQTLGAETIVELQLFKPDDIRMNSNNSSSLSTEDSSINVNNNNVYCNGPISSEFNTSSELTVVKKEPDSLVMNIKLKSTVSENTKSDQMSNTNIHKTASVNNSKPLLDSIDTDSEKKIVPKLVISNNRITKKNCVKPVSVSNGLNTKFVKCKDNEGRILLVPQSSLNFKQNNSAQSCTDTDSKNQENSVNKTVPSYILKVVPNQDSGQNQVLLIPLSEKKDKDTVSKSPSPIKDENHESGLISSNETFRKSTRVHYEQELEEIKLDYYKSFVELLKRVCKVFPLVRKDVDRSVFPFCAHSLEEFQSWNTGKQKASEWRRAGMVRKAILNLLTRKGSSHILLESVWSQSSIMSWCRKNSFVPMPTEKMTLLPEPKWSGVPLCSLTNAEDLVSTLVEEKYLVSDNDSDEELDVVGFCDVDEKPRVSIKTEQQDMCYMPYFSEAASFVTQTASQIDINFKPVEVEPQVYAPVAEEMIVAACRELASDLIGTALNEGFNRLGGKLCPEEVTVSDVFSAIKKTPKFDFLTNTYLGIPKDLSENT